MKRLFLVALTTAACAAYVAAQQPPPAGAARRPGEGRSPDLPVPTIQEYKPRSTLVVPQHQVPRAKFPVVDIHGHPPALTSVDVVNRIGDSMSPLNLQVMVDASSRVGDSIPRALEAIRASRYKGRFVTFAGLDLQGVGPGSGAAIAAQLEADVKAGAVGVGEIMKSFGLSIRKRDGSRLKLDDPELDPVWKKAAELNIPVLIHTGDPAEFFQPIDYHNERWLELVARSELKGPARELAAHAVFLGNEDGVLRLGLSADDELLNTPASSRALARALQPAFGAMPQLRFERVATTGAETLRQRSERERDARQEAAEAAFLADPGVQQLIRRHGATLVPDSIRPHDE